MSEKEKWEQLKPYHLKAIDLTIEFLSNKPVDQIRDRIISYESSIAVYKRKMENYQDLIDGCKREIYYNICLIHNCKNLIKEKAENELQEKL